MEQGVLQKFEIFLEVGLDVWVEPRVMGDQIEFRRPATQVVGYLTTIGEFQHC